MAQNNQEENRFEKKQPLRHPLASVAIKDNKIKINKQLYQILIDKDNSLDDQMLREKYDPYLDQYDFIVGDISSDHLRLKGFYKDIVRTAIDRKEKSIADYLIEYCNPGTAYFVLKLISPVHHYSNQEKHRNYDRKKRYTTRFSRQNNFKQRRVHQTTFPKKKTVVIQKGRGHKHKFVIKKRRDQM